MKKFIKIIVIIFAFNFNLLNAQTGINLNENLQIVYTNQDTIFGGVSSSIWEIENGILKPIYENRYEQKYGILKSINDSALLFNDFGKTSFIGNVLNKRLPVYQGLSYATAGVDTFSVFYIGDTINYFQYYNENATLIIYSNEMDNEVLYLSPYGTSFNNYGDVSFDVDSGNVSLQINKSGLCLPKIYNDPPPQNGAMYYNDSTNEFRRCKNGVWETY
jgi:hypothetical protein